jgi:hypothetical protein
LLQRKSGFEAVIESCPEALLPRLQALAAAPVIASGGHLRLEVAEGRVPELLGVCASNTVRLLSLNPLRFSLEDYFVELLRASELPHGPAAEVDKTS